VLHVELVAAEVLYSKHLANELTIIIQITIRLICYLHPLPGCGLDHCLRAIELFEDFVRLLAVEPRDRCHLNIRIYQILFLKDDLLLLQRLFNSFDIVDICCCLFLAKFIVIIVVFMVRALPAIIIAIWKSIKGSLACGLC